MNLKAPLVIPFTGVILILLFGTKQNLRIGLKKLAINNAQLLLHHPFCWRTVKSFFGIKIKN
jgi:hypothetical protein